MTPLFSWNGQLLSSEGKLAADESCCCSSGCDCYRIDYVWDITGCATLTGSILTKDFDIVCYDDANAVIVTNTIINYGPLCSIIPGAITGMVITCSNNISTIVLSIDSELFIDVIQFEGNLCCGALLGTFTADSLVQDHYFTMNISLNNTGACDCTGYETDVIQDS